MSLKIAAIVLAAGRSSRLGRPKQLVPFRGRSLLRHAVQAAIFSPSSSVTVVLGAFYPLLKRELVYFDADLVKNKAWMLGIGSSLKAGLRAVLSKEDTPYDGFLFLTCDQPLVDEFVLYDLCEAFTGRDQIIASEYGGASGIPVIIGRDHLEDLLQLADRSGAKLLLEQNHQHIKTIIVKGRDLDVDTAGDLLRMKKASERWPFQTTEQHAPSESDN